MNVSRDKKPAGTRTSSRAFTLVEIMIVVIILSVMAAAVVSNMNASYSRIAVESQAQLLCDTVAAAQQHSQARCLICRLDIDEVRGRYTIKQSAGANRPFDRAEGELGQTVNLPSNVRISRVLKIAHNGGSEDGIRFFPDGTSDGAIVTFESSSGERRIVRIPTFGGNATIEEPE